VVVRVDRVPPTSRVYCGATGRFGRYIELIHAALLSPTGKCVDRALAISGARGEAEQVMEQMVELGNDVDRYLGSQNFGGLLPKIQGTSE
jgi:hypothetical protein